MAKRKLTSWEILNLQKARDFQRETQSDKKEIDLELAKGNAKLIEFIERVDPWADLYSLPFELLLALFFYHIGWLEKIRAASHPEEVEDAKRALINDLMDEDKIGEVIESLDTRDDESKAEIFRVLIAIYWNQESIKRYYEPINVLISKIESDQDALFKAIAVDRSVVANPKVAKVISQAQIRDDAPFMALLANSVTRTKPIRKPSLDETRLMIEVINDLVGLESITQNHLTELLVNELEVYPLENNDPESSVKKRLQFRKKEKGSHNAI